MRDAMVAALTLNVFHRHAQRVKMANIAQLANVLQAMWLTKGEQMVLTPTYYVFKMYRPHQDAVAIPLNVDCDTITDANGRNIPTLAATASRAADGSVTITFTNPIVNQTAHVEIDLPKEVGTKIASAELLTAPDIHTRNTFENPDAVKTTTFTGAKVKGGKLLVDLPAVSVASLTLKK
jgi:alpha-N-arabinofuranosidase